MGMDLSAGDNDTIAPVNFSGKTYNFVAYNVDKGNWTPRLWCHSCRQRGATKNSSLLGLQLILVSLLIFAKFREIADAVGAYLW